MRLPDFLIIGAAKSGTTTLYKYLCQHPQIYMSVPKEPNFFGDDGCYAKGLDWYTSLFINAKSHQFCGEASTFYTLNFTSTTPLFSYKLQPVTVSKCAGRIAKIIPNVKLIYIMRNPIDRAYSHWSHHMRIAQYLDLKENTSKRYVTKIMVERFEDNMRHQLFYLENSNYMERIEQYLCYFPRESFLFLFMDDLIHATADTLRKVCNFLEIDEIDLTKGESIWANDKRYHFDNIIRSRITTPLKSIPGVSRVASLLPQGLHDCVYQGLRQLPTGKQIEQKYLPPPMLPETRKILIERFREPNQKLAEFLNCDLSHWSK
ncbi:sulfotransferase domain-containing protein [Coleofasciculus sp. F4-SAH-05]|uniref:sulfotransferase domain-containing protein n=1 Tax=Coleofasciculus sp. F4-SAH-05 TaxID=3069525 RepID=UPI0032F50FD6